MFLKQCDVTQHWDRNRTNKYFSPSHITLAAKLLHLLSLSCGFMPATASKIFARNSWGGGWDILGDWCHR